MDNTKLIERLRRHGSVKGTDPLLLQAAAALEAVKAETATEWAIARQDRNGELWDVSLLLDDRAEAERERAIWQAEFDADDDPVVTVERTKGIEPGEWRPVSMEESAK